MDYDRRAVPVPDQVGLLRMSGRTASRVAWALCALTLAAIAGALSFAGPNHVALGALSYLAFVVLFALVGAVVAVHRPSNPIGWLFALSGLGFALMEFTGEYAIYGAYARPGALPATPLMVWLQALFPVPAIMLFVAFVPLYFPDGHPLSPRWRLVAHLEAALVVAMVALTAVLPVVDREAGSGGPGFANPLGIAALRPLAGVHGVAFALLVVGSMGASTWSLVLRFRRSRGDERQQMKWLTYAVAAALALLALSKPFPALDPLSLVAICGVPVAVAVAVLRYRLYDIDLLINRTLVYGALTALIVGVYALVAGGLGALVQARGTPLVSVLAAGLVAALFAPLRERLQRAVNRLLYGDRDEPYAAIARLGRRLEGAIAPEAVLPTIVQTVRDALKLPYVAVEVGTEVVARSGTLAGRDRVLAVPIAYQGTPVGRLVVAPRAGSADVSPADRQLLDDLARQAGVAISAAHATADLQRARAQLVAAREEERRRLRRDLHDGLGSRLAALNLQATAVRGLIARDPAAASEAVGELRSEIRAAIADIRRVVYDLRPPALDEVGLVAAIRQRAARCSVDERAAERGGANRDNPTVRVMVEAPEALPPLPAAVEVAAYRIAEEALTNVVRHSGARTCVVRLEVEEGLRLEIADDGTGLPAGREEGMGVGRGLGLRSMRERAAELGGACAIEATPGVGTRVRAHLPFQAKAGAP